MARTSSVIATQSTETGYEWWCGGQWPFKRAFVASNGAAIVVYFYRLGNDLVWAFRYSNTARTSWSGHNVIATKTPGLFSSAYDQCAACMDAAGNVHVAMQYYIYGPNATHIDYCKLTRSGATWTAGSIYQGYLTSYDGTGRTRGLDIAFDGNYIIIAFHNADSLQYGDGFIYSSSGLLPNWYWVQLDASGSIDYSNPSSVSSAGNGVTFFLSVVGGASPKIKCRVLTGYTPAANVDLWASPLVVDAHDMAYYGAYAIYLGHANVDWVVLAKLEDGSQRLKKYKSGAFTGEVILRVNDGVNRLTQAAWNAASGLLYVWYKGAGFNPQTYNPANDAVSATTLDVCGTQVHQKIVDSMLVASYGAGGSGGTSTLTWYEDLIGETFSGMLCVQASALKAVSAAVPVRARQDRRYDGVLPAASNWAGWLGSAPRLLTAARKLVFFEKSLPVAAEDLINSVIFEKTVPIAARKNISNEAVLPCQASALRVWTKEAVPGDEWNKEASASDTWVKEDAIVDSWEKN